MYIKIQEKGENPSMYVIIFPIYWVLDAKKLDELTLLPSNDKAFVS